MPVTETIAMISHAREFIFLHSLGFLVESLG